MASRETLTLASRPNLRWRLASSVVMGLTGALCKGFLFGLNSTQTSGLEQFRQLLRNREASGRGRRRGLITVCNHISVLDDPLIWSVLPLRFSFDPQYHRWSLGAHDICFKNRLASLFFSLGQVLPTHRLRHSPHGGIFQPAVDQAINILSRPATAIQPDSVQAQTFSTTGDDAFLAPAAFSSNCGSWVHVFPEGLVHQHPQNTLRYFKWGISRLVLESTPTPDIVPMFIDGTQHIMPENRKWPRFVPRIGAKVHVAFGDPIDVDMVFGPQIQQWRTLMSSKTQLPREAPDEEATAVRIEVARRIRDEVVKLRRNLGYPDMDESFGLAETWANDPLILKSPVDGSIVRKG